MRNREMRALVFFDLPTVYAADRKRHAKFRKFLISEGFIMLQESVYSKLLLNAQQIGYLIDKIKRNSPNKGVVQILTVTEKQYANMCYVVGDGDSKVINDDERVVVL